MMRLSLFALMVTLAGCSAGSSAAAPTMSCSPPACQLESQLLALEVTPAPNQALMLSDVDLASVTVDPSSGLLQVQLPAPVIISGKVTVGQGARATILNGAVVATRASHIFGRPDKFYQTALDNPTGTYSLPVSPTAPGELYQLRIVSSDSSHYPPQLFTVDASITPGTPLAVHFDLQLDDPMTLTQISGLVTDLVGSPVPGMQVQAVDPTSKNVLSTTAITDGTGAYALRLSKKLPAQMVQLSATPTATAPMGTPALQVPLDVSHASAANTITANLATPPLPATQRFTYRVSGVGSSGAEMPVVNASCQFTAFVSDVKSGSPVTAVFQASADTTADGTVTVDLIPSDAKTSRDYQVTVSPPSTSDFQGASFTMPAGTTDGFGPPVTLLLRPQVSGRVIDANSQPIKNVTILPGPSTVAAALNATSLADLVKLSPTSTDSAGRFVLRVDSGTYDFGLIPLSAMMLPRKWLGGTMVTDDLTLGDVLLPPGAMVHAIVTDPSGNAVAAASVQLYSISPTNGTCSENACLAPPRLAAEGTSDAGGSVGLLLPAETAPLANTR